MTEAPAVWLTEQDVVELIDLEEAIGALADGLALEAGGGARNMAKTHVSWGDHETLHAIGAAFELEGVVGTKTWAHTKGGAAPLLVLFDGSTGAVQAVIEAFALGQLRTSAITGVATDHLSDPRADDLAVVGTGKQALAQVAVVAAVRSLRRVRVFSPTEAHRVGFSALVMDELGLAAEASPSVAEAVDGASLITLVTRATEPFLAPDMVATGAHVNALGAITPERMEFEPALLDRAAVIAADSVEQVRRMSAELRAYAGDDDDRWSAVVALSDIVAHHRARPAGADLTVFKAMGMGVSDLALGIRCLARSREEGRGTALPTRHRAAPRLRARSPSGRTP